MSFHFLVIQVESIKKQDFREKLYVKCEELSYMKFSELNLKPEILSGLEKMGFVELTEVQEQTFLHIMAGKDIVARAETGSGKTSACSVPMVQAIDLSVNAVQGLILVPTRELALQYVQEIAEIARQTEVVPFAVYGGLPTQIQKCKMEHGVHILVATPGRLIDLLYNTPLSLAEVRTFVLDEADEMLNMGFINDVEFVFSCLIHKHQTLLFSATMPAAIKRLAHKYLRDPVTIELNTEQVSPQSLQHCFIQVNAGSHFDALLDYLKNEEPAQTIIFCNSRNNVNRLYEKLSSKMKSVDFIHGGLEQPRRTSLFNRFRSNNIKIIIATNIASRGLDFSHVSHVINYDFPQSCEAYTHRTGRTARMGRKGIAMTFYTRANLRVLKEVIRINHIEPVWEGETPEFSNKSGKSRYRSSRRGRSGGRRRRH
ncbi:MAG: DEAD/DEAH box helicase [Sedimentisphaerales bacterium]|nr:DEAD/DEAH box helicase [Sedimentisphaerales bacterium]